MACKRPWKIYQRSLNTSRGLILRSSFVNRALHAAAPRRQTTAGSFPLADQRDLWCLGDKMERGNENKITRSFPQEPLTSDGSAQARLRGTGWRDASCGVFLRVLTALTCSCVQANERMGATVALCTASTWSNEQEKRERSTFQSPPFPTYSQPLAGINSRYEQTGKILPMLQTASQ